MTILVNYFNTTLTSIEPCKTTINTLELEVCKKFQHKINFNDIKNSDIINLYYDGLVQAKEFYK